MFTMMCKQAVALVLGIGALGLEGFRVRRCAAAARMRFVAAGRRRPEPVLDAPAGACAGIGTSCSAPQPLRGSSPSSPLRSISPMRGPPRPGPGRGRLDGPADPGDPGDPRESGDHARSCRAHASAPTAGSNALAPDAPRRGPWRSAAARPGHPPVTMRTPGADIRPRPAYLPCRGHHHVRRRDPAAPLLRRVRRHGPDGVGRHLQRLDVDLEDPHGSPAGSPARPRVPARAASVAAASTRSPPVLPARRHHRSVDRHSTLAALLIAAACARDRRSSIDTGGLMPRRMPTPRHDPRPRRTWDGTTRSTTASGSPPRPGVLPRADSVLVVSSARFRDRQKAAVTDPDRRRRLHAESSLAVETAAALGITWSPSPGATAAIHSGVGRVVLALIARARAGPGPDRRGVHVQRPPAGVRTSATLPRQTERIAGRHPATRARRAAPAIRALEGRPQHLR